MKTLMVILLAAIALEGLLLAIWPARVKAILGGSPDMTLRIVGIVEILFVVVLPILLW